MLPGGKRELGLRPAITEMEIMLVRRDWQAKQGQLAVEDDVVMAALRTIITRRCDLHAAKPELELDGAGYDIAISRRYEKYLRTCRRLSPGYTSRPHTGCAERFFGLRRRCSLLLAAR